MFVNMLRNVLHVKGLKGVVVYSSNGKSCPQSINYLRVNSAIQHAHEFSGHLDQKKTINKAEELYCWPNLKVDVCKYVKECVTC